jgi:inosose dehydratase
VGTRIAVAPDSWGIWFANDPRQVPWSTFLDEAAAAGFDAIELGPWGYLPTNAEILRPELARRELTLTGAFVMTDFLHPDAWATNKDHIGEVCALLNEFGSEHLVLLNTLYTDLLTGKVVAPTQLDKDTWPRMLDVLNAIGEASAREGIRAVFHPHADSVIEYEPAIEMLLERSDPATVALCLDIGHHAYCGGEAVSFMRRHHDRIPYLHLKNVDPTIIESVRRDGVAFAAAVQEGAFTTLDAGVIDLRQFRDALNAVGYDGWAVVEQDMYPAPPEKPLPIARQNRAFLRDIGIG